MAYERGGGTFDVSLLSINDDAFEALVTTDGPHLGGEAFNSGLIDYVAKQYKQKTGTGVIDDLRALGEVRCEVEKVNHILSRQWPTCLTNGSFAGGNDFSETLTRAKFEAYDVDLFYKIVASLI